MCGITGFADGCSGISPDHILKKMTDVLHRRGPDDSGTDSFIAGSMQLGLGQRRLSIIELSPLGHQPMWDEGKNLCIVYNGEVYNYQEIREDLKREGYSFKSNSDTEVVLYSFSRWGLGCVNRFIGMFAFAIFSKIENKIYLCRDRLGVKPLYYYLLKDLFLFSSGVRSFHQHPYFVKEIDQSGLADYMELGYISKARSIFKNVKKVLSGTWLIYDLAKREVTEHRYWDITSQFPNSNYNYSRASVKEELRSIMVSAFKYRLVADVPIGVFLSGGIDSSLLASILTKEVGSQITTMTIGFREKDYNEAPFARKTADYLGTNHLEEYCTSSEALKFFSELPEAYDEPFGDSSAIPTLLLSQIASKYRKVVLSADGGDELFAGYPAYQIINRYFKGFLRFPLSRRQKILGILKKNFQSSKSGRLNSILGVICDVGEAESVHNLCDSLNNPFSKKEITNLLYNSFPSIKSSKSLDEVDDIILELKNYDLRNYLIDDILVKVDRATMHSSIESREPFLDHRIVEFAASLPSRVHLNSVSQKLLLKELLSDYLPKSLFDRPKQGFEVPIRKWLTGSLRNHYDFYLSENQIKKSGLIDYVQVKYYKDLFTNNINIRGLNRKLWHLIVFQVWYERWMGGDN